MGFLVPVSEHFSENQNCKGQAQQTNLGPMDSNRQSEPPTTRRRYPRYEIETELTATILGVGGREMRGRSLNINEGGVSGVFTAGWEVGVSVNLQFSVPVATIPLRIRGVIRNRTGYRYGFEFAELTPQQQETISRTCRMLGLLE